MTEETKAVTIWTQGGAIQPKSFGQIKAEEKFLKEYVDEFLEEGEFKAGADYGSVPGIDHMAFYTGICKVMRDFNLAEGDPIIDKEKETILIQGRKVDHLTYTIKTPIMNTINGNILGVAKGTCSTLETKYRFRGDNRICPDCEKATITEGKEEFGGGWVCWKKQGGCGKKFKKDDTRITEQPVGKQENLNPYDLSDTAMFMAGKRGVVKMVLYLTGLDKYVKVPAAFQDEGVRLNRDNNGKQKGRKTEPPTKEEPQKQQGANGPEKPTNGEKKEWKAMSLEEKQDMLDVIFLDYFGTPEAVESFLRSINSAIGNVKAIKSDSQAGWVYGQFKKYQEEKG